MLFCILGICLLFLTFFFKTTRYGNSETVSSVAGVANALASLVEFLTIMRPFYCQKVSFVSC